MGRLIAWQALARGKPIIVLDPTGGIVSNVIDKIRRLPLEARRQLWSRVIYVDVGATDHVVPAPLYYRLSTTDTLFANTPVDLVALYWHLVDLIWIYLFPLLYLID